MVKKLIHLLKCEWYGICSKHLSLYNNNGGLQYCFHCDEEYKTWLMRKEEKTAESNRIKYHKRLDVLNKMKSEKC